MIDVDDAEDLTPVREVKYSLRGLLKEVEAERRLSEFSREAVDQEEISKLFQRSRKRGKRRRGGQ
jgi:hypothetical protein